MPASPLLSLLIEQNLWGLVAQAYYRLETLYITQPTVSEH